MHTKWIEHLRDSKDQEEFKDSVYRAGAVLQRLKDICIDMEQTISRSEQSPKIYDCANWANLQAHYNGYRQCLSQIKSLIDHRENKHE
ncbi:MAG TPA: hypothetical protein VEP90_04635 [Methylomirabilota bacterium]|nr:hypothetical protein [Methylomirabilota bacterium]